MALAAQYFPNDVVPVRQARSYFAQNYGDDLRLTKPVSYTHLTLPTTPYV